MIVIGRAELCPVCRAPIRWVRGLDSEHWAPVSDYRPGRSAGGRHERLDWTSPPAAVESHPSKACPGPPR